MVNFRPIGNRVLLKRIENKTTTASGIVLPGASAVPSNQAVVAAVGRGTLHDNGVLSEPSVKVGMHVVAARNAGSDIKIGDDMFWIVRDHDIMYTVEHKEDEYVRTE